MLYIFAILLLYLFARQLANAEQAEVFAHNNALKATAICVGSEGIPICLHKLDDLSYFHDLRQLSFHYQINVRDATLYSILLDDANRRLIHNVVASGTWIQYECQSVQFKLPLGVHNHLYAHYSFNIYLQKSRIAAEKMEVAKIQVIGSRLHEVATGSKHAVTYDLHWVQIPEQLGRYSDGKLTSLINSAFMLCVMLTVTIFLVVKNSNNNERISRIFGAGSQFSASQEALDNGWKSLYADVFREPWGFPLFAVLQGIGAQALTAFLLNQLANCIFSFQTQSFGTFALFYCFSGWIGGTVTSFLVHSYEFMHVANIVRIGCLFQAIVGIMIFILLNFLSLVIKSTLKPDWIDFVLLLAGFSLVNAPLSLLAGRLGGRLCQFNKFPYKSTTRERKTATNYFVQLVSLVSFSGILPFVSLLHEAIAFSVAFRDNILYYCALLAVSLGLCCTSSILTTFTLLNMDYYRWHWVSFVSGGVGAFYLFIYSILKAYWHIYSFSLVPFAIYALKASIMCLLLFLVQGSIAHLATQWFVRKIYSSIRFD